MRYYVYILKSLKTKGFYIGSTLDLEKRVKRHNSGKVNSTRLNRPWKIIYTEEFAELKEARAREVKIKSYKGGNAFKNLIKET